MLTPASSTLEFTNRVSSGANLPCIGSAPTRGDAAGCSHTWTLLLIAKPRVGLRPGRIEPRQRKRRPKAFPLMTKPRPEAREQVRLNGHPKKQK
jgi:hypothetical protein